MFTVSKKIIKFFVEPINRFGFFYGFKIGLRKIINSFQYIRTKEIGLFNKDYKNIKKIIKSGDWSSSPYPSNYAKKFSEEFLKLNNAKFGVCISNGTDALRVAYKAAGLKYGDKIIVPSLTFHTTASAALELGIVPIFADIEQNTLCINPDEIENKITQSVKAVVIVHLGSIMANLEKIANICKKNNLVLIEDCAHAHGAMWNDSGAGTYGDFGCYSFQSSKVISSGEGGFIITKTLKDLNKCISYINCGRESQPFSSLALNHRLTDIQCALLLESLKKFKKYSKKRNENIKYFTQSLSKIPEIEILLPYLQQSRFSGYAYGFRLSKNILKKINREDFVKDLLIRGVNCNEHLYPPVYLTPEFGWKDSPIKVSYENTKCLIAENTYYNDTIWIAHPFFVLNKKSIEHAVRMIKDSLNEILLK